MLNRRSFLSQAAKSSTALAVSGALLHTPVAASITRIESVRAPSSLGVTMGSISGNALSILAYIALTQAVPAVVIGAFVGILGASVASRSITRATRTYVDYRMEESNFKLLKANHEIRTAMNRDTEDLNRLTQAVADMGQQLNKIRNEGSRREYREIRSLIREEFDILREENDRSLITARVHDDARTTFRSGSSEENAKTELACSQVLHAQGNLKQLIQELQRASM